MDQSALTTLEKKYRNNAMCLCLIADLRILLEQEKSQKAILKDLQDHIHALKDCLTI